MLKSIIFLVKSYLGNFYRHLVIFSGHTGLNNKIVKQNFVLISGHENAVLFSDMLR